MENKSKLKKFLLIIVIILVIMSSGYIFFKNFGIKEFEKLDNQINITQNKIFPKDYNLIKVVLPMEADSFLSKKLSELSESTVFTVKYYVEFDGGKTYTIWLYTRERPDKNQIESIIKVISIGLTDKLPGYYFNFNIFPDSSKKIPDDSLVYDNYFSVMWRNGEVIFPIEDKGNLFCPIGKTFTDDKCECPSPWNIKIGDIKKGFNCVGMPKDRL